MNLLLFILLTTPTNILFSSLSPPHFSQRSRRGGSSSGGGLFGSKKAAAPPARSAPRPTPPAPAPAAHPPAVPQQQSGGMLSGIGSTIAQGMAFGTGSAIAHRAVGAVANSFGGDGEQQPVQQVEAQQQPMQAQGNVLSGPCAQDKEMFYDCLKVNRGDQQACSFLYDQLQTCQRTETTFN